MTAPVDQRSRSGQAAHGSPCSSARLVLYAVFVLFPIVQAVTDFFKWNGLPLTNYIGSPTSGRGGAGITGAVQRNVFVIVLSLIVQIPFALGGPDAQPPVQGRTTLRLVFFAPYVIAEVITGVVWSLLLQPGGLAEGALSSRLGSLYQPWLAGRSTVMLAMFFIISWKCFSFH
jgi:raffinose/stachyose/melibiose transport system permease protein